VSVQPPPHVVEIASRLIRFDTSNPPGNEAQCVQYIRQLVDAAGLETTVVWRDPDRPNLIARLRGRGEQAPLLVHGHVDVVPAGAEGWERDPFGGQVVDGELWGRGAVDMKGGLAMMIGALLRLSASGLRPPGDVVFAALSDEEGGSEYGARYMVERHPELFAGIRYAIGEFGGIARPAGGRNLYLVPLAEKQWCTLRARFRGPGGHGALPSRGGAMARAARAIASLDGVRLPHHLCGISATMIDAYAGALPAGRADRLLALKDPLQADRVLDEAAGAYALFDAAVHNTITPTVLRGGTRVDAVPEMVELELDGRVLPGQRPETLIAELRGVCGEDLEVDLTHVDRPPAEHVDTGLLGAIEDALRALDRGRRSCRCSTPASRMAGSSQS
jgi:acetylornithine deacetylase/succinyl-diaminopimelate desuccinylase-like protein